VVPQEVVDAEVVETPAEESFAPVTETQQPEPDTFRVEQPQAKPARREPDEPRRPCPMCGEEIRENAAKCRFCGEVLDPKLRGRRKRSRSGGRYDDEEDMTGWEWALGILLPGIGCIVGIVWMLQGKHKGGKMFMVSFGFGFGFCLACGFLRGLLFILLLGARR
jgi:hypothetical protein